MSAIFITPVECTPGTGDSWQDVDLDTYVGGLGADVSGAILHIVTGGDGGDAGVRKNGSSDNRHAGIDPDQHCWAMIGVDSNHKFEAYVGDTTDVSIYIVGYTTTGVVFFDNGINKTPGTDESWQDVNCSANVPAGAVGLIFEINVVVSTIGMRKNGSSDNRTHNANYRSALRTIVVGCDANRICEAYYNNDDGYHSFYLIGYIEDGAAVFNTNATDLSLGSTGSWADLSSLPAGATGAIIEVVASSIQSYGLRADGSAEDVYYDTNVHTWAVVGAAGGVVEGKIETTGVDFYLVGYFIDPVLGTAAPIMW